MGKFKIDSKILLIALVFVFTLTTAYLFGKTSNQKIMQETPEPSINLEPGPVVSDPPKNEPVKGVQKTFVPTTAPTRKKVAVEISNSLLKGTYYCYEDKANLITTTQSNLLDSQSAFDNCIGAKSIEDKNCHSSCLSRSNECSNQCRQLETGFSDCSNDCTSQFLVCGDSCPNIQGICDDKINIINDNLQKLKQMISDYCP